MQLFAVENAVVSFRAIYIGKIDESANGRQTGLDPVNLGSNPSSSTIDRVAQWSCLRPLSEIMRVRIAPCQHLKLILS